MRHRVSRRTLSRTSSHRKAMFNNMSESLIRHERIQTTEAKAKDLRSYVEKLITLGKKGDYNAKKLAARKIKDEEILNKLFGPIAKRFADRPGGYTRIIKLAPRLSDSAKIALIELVDRDVSVPEVKEEAPKKKAPKKATAKKEEASKE